MPSWIDEYKTMHQDILNRQDSLTDWESDFIQSMSEWFEAGKTSTPRQCEVIERIWEKVTK